MTIFYYFMGLLSIFTFIALVLVANSWRQERETQKMLIEELLRDKRLSEKEREERQC